MSSKSGTEIYPDIDIKEFKQEPADMISSISIKFFLFNLLA